MARPFADNDGVRIRYLIEWQGPPLVLQHWSVATLENWYDFGYDTAHKNDYRLILLDARVHGASDKQNTPDAYDIKKRVGALHRPLGSR
jgi:pimeloyl-ACP methyl ester carboxylesterase